MSSSEPRRAGRRALLAALPLLALAGCGLRPLYGAGGDNLRGQILFDSVGGRIDHHFTDRLAERLGRPDRDPAYALETELFLGRTDLAISPTDDITRYEVIGTAVYALRRRGDGAEAARGEVRSVSAYSTLATPYATRVAERDAERRVAEDLADRVFARLAAAIGPA